jgi:hypothetical protein
MDNGVMKSHTTKPDAVRRQLEAAIRMLFSGEDPLAVHTVAAAAFRIVRDLAEKSGKSSFHESVKQMIRPGKENKFWGMLNKSVNFLKHADSDPTEMLELEEELNDDFIGIACLYYESLGNKLTPIMVAYMGWWIFLNPDFINKTAQFQALLARRDFAQYRSKPRIELLKLGKLFLKKVTG